jgi:diguanylate cyclase (GGDEF)-like protein
MPIRTKLRDWGPRAKSLVAPALLFVGALFPALSLLSLRFAPLDPMAATHPFVVVLTVVVPLSTFLLAICLWQARHRIMHLQIKEQEAIENAGLDPLSRLPNRLFFERLLESAIANASEDAPVALFAIDIDRFKSVNDTHGHQAGDRVIVAISKRIKRIIREGDCIARIGGDEFALMLVSVSNMAQCAAMAHRIHDAMLAPIDIGRAQVFVTLSLGIAVCPQDGDGRGTLSDAADLALYRAKAEGRNRFAFFDKTMEQKLHLGATIEDDLRRAISEDGLTILYQPLMAPCGTRMQGLEALVRWHHPDHGLMSPDEFIPLAESRGLIVPLGEWVLRRACRDARRWPGLRMAVNVSPVQFRQRGFVDTVRSIIESTGIDPTRLDLELTEGVLIQDAEQAEIVIIELRSLGIRIGLDDFGSGYSSLIYLRRFAFDKIKIDKAFLESMELSGEGAIILEYIVSLGHALGLTVTAEGVEQIEQVAFLRALGCDEMQGFFFAPPLTAEAIDERLSLNAWADLKVEAKRSAA